MYMENPHMDYESYGINWMDFKIDIQFFNSVI